MAGAVCNRRSRRLATSRRTSSNSLACFISSIRFRNVETRQCFQEPPLAPGQASADGFWIDVSCFGDFPKRELSEKMEMDEVAIGIRQLVYRLVQDGSAFVFRR